MAGQVCAIIGFGPGLGAAYAKIFLEAGYDLALLSRSGAELTSKPAANSVVKSYACDTGIPETFTAVLEQVESDMGTIEVMIYNADLGQFGTLEEVSETELEQSWRVSVLGLFTAAKLLGPRMSKRGTGKIIVSGATAALRGNDWTTAFAPAKAAQRILSQSLAKQLGPKGVHVAYLIIDGVIDTQDTRQNFSPNAPDEFYIQPDQIAKMALFVAEQDRSAWTFEVDMRPFGEKW
ncbi:MAG: SDR family NAD(P)-dependent oxidoreductase [Rhizobiaceae bacterium]|nr:SDR family NAD(P)-dependent oxidoreductase [Rhizobiaceae bacterium]